MSNRFIDCLATKLWMFKIKCFIQIFDLKVISHYRSRLRLGLSIGHFPISYLTKLSTHFSSLWKRETCLSHFIAIDSTTLIIFGILLLWPFKAGIVRQAYISPHLLKLFSQSPCTVTTVFCFTGPQRHMFTTKTVMNVLVPFQRQ